MRITMTHKKGNKFSFRGVTYEFIMDVTVTQVGMKHYVNEKEVDLRSYARYVEPFDENAWREKMAKRNMYFHGDLGYIFW